MPRFLLIALAVLIVTSVAPVAPAGPLVLRPAVPNPFGAAAVRSACDASECPWPLYGDDYKCYGVGEWIGVGECYARCEGDGLWFFEC